MPHLSIRLKLVVLTGLFVVLLVGILIFVSARSITAVSHFATEELSQVQQVQAEALLKSTANNAQSNVESFLGKTASTVTLFASMLNQTAEKNGGVPFSRERVYEITKDLLTSTKTMSALYAQFEKNGYDGRDAEFTKETMNSSRLGTLDTYWVNEGGKYVSYIGDPDEKSITDKDENGVRTSEWYLCSAETGAPCLLDPYLYDITENTQVLMTSYSEPILVKGKFVGLVGGDINLPQIQKALLALSAGLFNGKGDITVVSQRGIVAGSSAIPESIGKSIKKTTMAALDLTKNGLTKSQQEWVYSSHFTIGNAAQQWTVLVTVPTNVLLAASQHLSAQLQVKNTESVSLLIVMAVALVLTGLGLIYFMISTLTAPLGLIASRMRALASEEGDLTQRLEAQKHKELSQLAEGFNEFVDKLQKMVLQLNQQNSIVAQTNHIFIGATGQVDSSISSQTEQIHSVVTAVTEMSSSAYDVANLAQENGRATSDIRQYLNESFDLVQTNKDMVESLAGELNKAGSQVDQVSQRSNAIYGILDTIRAVSEQTNLLALNAAIEAARAGEQGRGFAVVADEVRSLAARTQASTEEVDILIKGLQEDVRSAVSMIAHSQEEAKKTVSSSIESAEKLGFVNERVSMVSENTIQVASAATEQSNVAEAINKNLVVISDSTQSLRDIVANLESGHVDSAKAVDKLTEILSKFKVER